MQRVGGAGMWLQQRISQIQGQRFDTSGGGRGGHAPPRREAFVGPAAGRGGGAWGRASEEALLAEIRQRMSEQSAAGGGRGAVHGNGNEGVGQGGAGAAVMGGLEPPSQEVGFDQFAFSIAPLSHRVLQVISRVCGMGFGHEQAVAALGMFDNDVERAVNHLLESGG